jgi:hypothetical protein
VVETYLVAMIALATPAAAEGSRDFAHALQTTPSVIRMAQQAPARPDGAVSGSCYVNGKRYPDGAMVPLDPGPRSLVLAPIYVRCVRGRLCSDTMPAVCVPVDHVRR